MAKTFDPAFDQASPGSAPAMDRRGLERLLAAVAAGDAQAFERLYHATSAKLFGVCLRLLSDRSDAEDVLQDAYAAIWRKAAQYDAAIASPITWLAMIAHNKAIDRCAPTAPRATRCRSNSPGRERCEPGRRRAGRTCRRSAPARPLPAAPRSAPPHAHRTAFFDGATYEELARRTDTPIGTVKSWIRRGLLQLRTCLEA
jgi:RNA polymerase sigma-70 factor (ECF subfamily)